MLTLLSSVGDSATLTVAHPAAPPAPNLRRCKLIGVQIRWLVIGYRCFTYLDVVRNPSAGGTIFIALGHEPPYYIEGDN